MERTDAQTRRRFLERLEEIELNPFNERTKQLTNLEGARVARVGGWRIIYRVDTESCKIIVADIDRRGQVYNRN